MWELYIVRNHDTAILHVHNSLHLRRHLDIVGDHDEGDPLVPVQAAEEDVETVAGFLVQVAAGLAMNKER